MRSVSECVYILVGGQVIYNVHDEAACAGRPCCVHDPSDHSMADWPQRYRGDWGFMERMCRHGIGHPDPDDPSAGGVHSCDGCCRVSRLVTASTPFI